MFQGRMPRRAAAHRAMVGTVTLVWALSGCQRPDAPDHAAEPVRPAAAVSLTAAQQQLYTQSCKNCHENPAMPAPQTHALHQWEPRMQQGMDTLLTHTVAGFNQMPAGGLCTTCTADDYKALIGYMAQARGF